MEQRGPRPESGFLKNILCSTKQNQKVQALVTYVCVGNSISIAIDKIPVGTEERKIVRAGGSTISKLSKC